MYLKGNVGLLQQETYGISHLQFHMQAILDPSSRMEISYTKYDI